MCHPVKRSSNLRCGRQNIDLIMHFELHTYFLSSILKSQGSALKKTLGYTVEAETGAGADVQAAAARRWAAPQARAELQEDRVLRRLVALLGPLSSLTQLLRALELRGSSPSSLPFFFQRDDNTLGLLFGELVMKGIASGWGTPSACETKAKAASIFL